MSRSSAMARRICRDADAAGRLAFLPGFEAQTLAHLPYHPRDAYGAISLSFSLLAPLHRDVADAFYSGQSAEAHALQAASRCGRERSALRKPSIAAVGGGALAGCASEALLAAAALSR